jgi:arsenate reductase
MKKVYYLASCSTCQKILKALGGLPDFEHREIKSAPITAKELDHMAKLAGSYGALFSRRSMLYKSRNLKEKILTEQGYRELILEHYTFLSRPVFIIDDKIYIGNAQKNIDAVAQAIHA